MRVIIAGGRDFHQYQTLLDAVRESGFDIRTVISGGATGVDAMGERYAQESQLPVQVYAADWNQHGRAAGPIRNRTMAQNADALIAIWDGRSPGTKNMIDIAQRTGLQIYVKRV